MTYFFRDTKKVIDTFNVVLDEIKHCVFTHNGQIIASSESKLGFKSKKTVG